MKQKNYLQLNLGCLGDWDLKLMILFCIFLEIFCNKVQAGVFCRLWAALHELVCIIENRRDLNIEKDKQTSVHVIIHVMYYACMLYQTYVTICTIQHCLPDYLYTDACHSLHNITLLPDYFYVDIDCAQLIKSINNMDFGGNR